MQMLDPATTGLHHWASPVKHVGKGPCSAALGALFVCLFVCVSVFFQSSETPEKVRSLSLGRLRSHVQFNTSRLETPLDWMSQWDTVTSVGRWCEPPPPLSSACLAGVQHFRKHVKAAQRQRRSGQAPVSESSPPGSTWRRSRWASLILDIPTGTPEERDFSHTRV